jgi:hypothetical protein
MRVIGADGENLWISTTHTFVPPAVVIVSGPENQELFVVPVFPPISIGATLRLRAPRDLTSFAAVAASDTQLGLTALAPDSVLASEAPGPTEQEVVAPSETVFAVTTQEQIEFAFESPDDTVVRFRVLKD